MVSTFRSVLAIMMWSAGAAAADPAWTMHDLDAVADAAVEAANGKSVEVSWLVQLADALKSAGDTPRAKAVLLNAAKMLTPPTELMAASDRGNVAKGLAQLGDAADAEAIANVDAAPGTKAMLLGKLVSGLAAAGDIEDVHRAADMLAPLASAPGITTWVIATPIASSLSGAAAALVSHGAANEALYLANLLPDGIPKVDVLSETGIALCGAPTKEADHDMGRKVAEDSVNATRAALPLFDRPIERVDVIDAAAGAVVQCEGAQRAKAFIADVVGPRQSDQALSRLADGLTRKHAFDLAAAVAPTPDPNDPASLLDAAERLAQQGDHVAAVSAAIAASKIVSKSYGDPSQPPSESFDHMALLGRIFDALSDLGAYDAALETVPPIGFLNRQQYYMRLVHVAIDRKDVAAIDHLLPMAIDGFKQNPPPGTVAAASLFELTRALAVGGYLDEAQKPYSALIKLTDSSSTGPRDSLPAWKFAELKADMGDLPGALRSADEAGPLDTPASPALVGIAAAMQFDGAAKPPDKAEFAAATQRANSALPHLVSGPKANALGAIAVDKAAQGDIKAAFQAESELEDAPRPAVLGVRDTALLSIATAQQKAGELRGSFATALRIEQPTVRWAPLLKLAGDTPR